MGAMAQLGESHYVREDVAEKTMTLTGDTVAIDMVRADVTLLHR